MPDQSSAADEHAILQEITAPLATLPDDALPIAAEADFPVVLRGYDRVAVDAYVKRTSQVVAELQSTRSPEAAVRRALERVGEQITGILKRAHETAEQITTQSRREAEDRLEAARQEATNITSSAQERVKELDAETDRIWAERHRIVNDARDLASQLQALATAAAARFPPAAGESSEVAAVTAEPAANVGTAPGGRPLAGARPVAAAPATDDEPAGPEAGANEEQAGPEAGANEEQATAQHEAVAGDEAALAGEHHDDGDDQAEEPDSERTGVLPALDPDDPHSPGAQPER
jgi:vacuolar-type H+-ATPase subunit H